jgi:hypothetical protein
MDRPQRSCGLFRKISKISELDRYRRLLSNQNLNKARQRLTFGSLAVCLRRPMALRPRLAEGLPFRGQHAARFTALARRYGINL